MSFKKTSFFPLTKAKHDKVGDDKDDLCCFVAHSIHSRTVSSKSLRHVFAVRLVVSYSPKIRVALNASDPSVNNPHSCSGMQEVSVSHALRLCGELCTMTRFGDPMFSLGRNIPFPFAPFVPVPFFTVLNASKSVT